MHRLVPDFILQQFAAGKFQGRLPALAVFVDISGFSTITESLLQHGQHGAEVLAICMRAVFDPLIRGIYEQGGFIVGFAGDAFTALFPETADQSAPARAVTAGWLIQQRLRQNATQATVYGTFTFSVKVGIGIGTAEWGIVHARDDSRSSFYFKGSAISNCTVAEHLASQGDVILTSAVWPKVETQVSAEPVGRCFRLVAVNDAWQQPPKPVQLPPVEARPMARFVPYQLVTQRYSGEFRWVLNLFIALKGSPSHARVTRFMQAVFELQVLYGGLLNRIDFGDKGCHLLFFWGAPTAYENDVSRILNFILALRERSAIPLRAGITYRNAHAGFIGSPLHEEYTCYGRGVNLAARFMTAADWGEIWVDEEVAQRARGFRIGYRDERFFKGFTAREPVYTLDGHETKASEPFFSRQLVGREAELAQLEAFMAPLRDGRFAGVATISGEAGIGKSHLVHHFLETSSVLDAADIYLCQTDEILRQSLNPFRYWLREYFDQSPEQDEASNRQCFDRILDRLIENTADDVLRASLERGRSFLGALVDVRRPGSLHDRLEPQLRFENTLDALKALIKAESRQQPVLVVVEDGHWLDDDSGRFLRRLVRNVDAYPFALLITSREEIAPDLPAPEVATLSLSLPPLAETAVARLATGLLGRAAGPDLLRFLQQRSDGNPYLAEQLLLYLRENNLLRSSFSQENLAATGHLVPTDVQAVLVARLDRLVPAVKEVVQTAAVLGREFERPILAQMVDGSIDDGLEAATSEAIWRALDNRRYLFRHALMRDAAYSMQLHARLQQLHQQAAVAYETLYEADLASNYGQIAYHYDQGQVGVKALAYYERAAGQAKDNYQNEEALTYYRRALTLTGESDLETRYRLLLGQETVYNWLGRRQAQAEVLQALATAAEQLNEGTKKAQVALRHANLARLTSDYASALDAVDQALTMAAHMQDDVTKMEIYHLWGRTLWQQGDYDEARGKLEHALELARSKGDRRHQARNQHDIGVICFYQARYAAAQRWLEEALLSFRADQDDRGEANCLIMLGAIRRKVGQYLDGHQNYERALEICQASGWLHGKSFIYGHLGNSYFELGDYQQARVYHSEALTICREVNDREGEAVSLDTLGLIAHDSGDLQTATAHFEAALAIQQSIGDQRGQAYTETHLGYTLSRLEQFEAAEGFLQHARQLRQKLGEISPIVDSLAGLATNALASGEGNEAQWYVDQVLAHLEKQGINGVELPVQVYWICYQVLWASVSHRARARAVLQAGYELLQERAAAIQDEALRQQFLQAVPYNRALQQAWQGREFSA